MDNIRYNQKLSFRAESQGSKESLVHQLYIGDNLDSLKYLENNYKGLVNIIYIDPPYGCNSLGKCAKTNYTNKINRKELLDMLEPRLVLANKLLSENGVIFCSIDELNHAYLKCMMDEIFGEDNFIGNLIRKTRSVANQIKSGMNIQHEYVIVYGKNKPLLYGGEKCLDNYKNPDNDIKGDWKSSDPSVRDKKYVYAIHNPLTDKDIFPPEGRGWLFSEEKLKEHIESGRIVFNNKKTGRGFTYKRYKSELKSDSLYVNSLDLIGTEYMNSIGSKDYLSLGISEDFDYPKPVCLIKKLLSMVDNKNALVLDFFAGSGTTGQAVLELNKGDGGSRRFILCTNNENKIAERITSERLRRVMTGMGSNGETDFKWLLENEPLGDSLGVYEVI